MSGNLKALLNLLGAIAGTVATYGAAAPLPPWVPIAALVLNAGLHALPDTPGAGGLKAQSLATLAAIAATLWLGACSSLGLPGLQTTGGAPANVGADMGCWLQQAASAGMAALAAKGDTTSTLALDFKSAAAGAAVLCPTPVKSSS